MLFGKKKEKEQRSVLEEEQMQSPSVSYTHLTLPTNSLV